MAGQTVARRLPEIARDVAAVANEAVAAARQSGREEAATTIRMAASRWSEPEITVVVAGGIGTGKSALVAALAGRPDLLPTGTGATTAVVTTVRAAPAADSPGTSPSGSSPAAWAGGTPSASAQVWLDGSETPTPLDQGSDADIAAATLWRWTTRGGDRPDGVARVDVMLHDCALPARLVLVDTPGTGGALNPADNLVVGLLTQADALLYVLDAAAPVSRFELDLLARARRQVGVCLTAMSRVDRYRGAARVAEDSATAMRAELGGWAGRPMLASSVLAAQAQPGSAPGLSDELRSALLAESGIPTLRDRLADLVGHARHTRLVGLTSLVGQVLYTLEQAAYEEQVAAASTTDDLRAEQEAVGERQAALRQHAERAQHGLADDLAAVREELGIALRSAATELSLANEQRLQAAGKPGEGVLDALEQDLRAAQLRYTDRVEQALAAVSSRVAQRLDGGDPAATEEDGAPTWTQRPAPAATPKDRSLQMRFVAAMASAGGGVALVATSVFSDGVFLLLRGGAMGASLLIGALVAGSGVRAARQQRALTTARTASKGLLEAWQAEVASRTRLRLTTAQRELDAGLRAAVRGRSDELTVRQAEVAELIRSDAQQRRAVGAAASARRATLAELRTRVSALKAELAAAAAPTGAAATGAAPSEAAATGAAPAGRVGTAGTATPSAGIPPAVRAP